MKILSVLVFSLSSSPCSTQMLPGVDRPQSSESLHECTLESHQLLSVEEIRNVITHINHQAAQIVLEDVCVSEAHDYKCPLDYSKFDHDLEKLCGKHKGKYMESAHKIVCTAPPENLMESGHQELSQQYIIELLHFPDCYATTCAAADIERMVARSVRLYEKELEVQMRPNFFCHSDYTLNDGQLESIMEQEQEDEEKIQELNESLEKEMQDLEGPMKSQNSGENASGGDETGDETGDESASNRAATSGVAMAVLAVVLLL